MTAVRSPWEVAADLLDPPKDVVAERRKYEWELCGLAKCDGQPHEGMAYKHPRPEQVPPDDDPSWLVNLFLAGRAVGKSRAGAEWVKKQLRRYPQSRWAIVAPTFGDARDTCLEGDSGLLSVLPPEEVKTYNRSIGELIMRNGSRAKLFSADEPDRLRGPQFHGAWLDEMASFRYEDAWHQLQFGLRLGERPRVFVTTTPRPTKLIRTLLSRNDGTVRVVRGSTFDNAANLAPSAIAELRRRYEGTRLGRQELHGELLSDVPGSIATYAEIEDGRVQDCPEWVRGIVSVDPAVTDTESSDETGITVERKGVDGECYLVADWSCRLPVDDWAARAVSAAVEFECGMILYEKNQGADAIGSILKTAMERLGVKDVVLKDVTALKSKFDRALPLQQWIQQRRFHLVGSFPELEDQLATTTADNKGPSPDRLDSACHGFRELMLEPEKQSGGFFFGDI